MEMLVTQLCLTFCDPMDYSPPGSSVHGILQARILEWVAISSCRGIFLTQGSNPCLLRLLHWQAGSIPLVVPGKPNIGSTGRRKTNKCPRQRILLRKSGLI